MAQLFKNNAYSALAASLTNVATTLTVTTGQGDRFPIVSAPDFFVLTLQDASNNIEVVRVTARTAGADSMTITRAQEGTTARAWNIGDVAELRLTAFGLNPLSILEGEATAAGILGKLNGVSLTGDQTVAGVKTFSSPIVGSTNSQVSLTGDQTVAGVKTFSSFPVLPSITGGFYKSDSSTVAFTKTGNGTASIKAGTLVDVAGKWVQFATATAITMPTLTAGTDYAIWVKDDGTIQADASFTVAPGTGNWRKIGGFHYAPGGNATGASGGNTTAQINEYSFWDLKFRPECSDPRGMTLVAGGFWVDIYLTGVDAITNGSSKYNVTMADGSSPPKVPTMFGGNGSTTYGSYTWFEAQELATAFGKRTLTQQEFMAAAYGTTEASSVGIDQVSTILNAAYTSKWGVIQATGVLWVWGLDRGGPFAAASWNANTEGRGSEYNAPNASLLGGAWVSGSVAGSRCSTWANAASDSSTYIGSRFACDHLQLD